MYVLAGHECSKKYFYVYVLFLKPASLHFEPF